MSVKRDAIIGRAFGIGAALAYAISSVLIRQGLADLAPPLVGAAVGLLSGTLALAIIGTRNLGGAKLVQNKRSIVFLLISGVAASLGVVSSFFALSLAPVVLVSPLQSTSPLFTLLLSYLFLSHLERITPKLIMGSILVVLGAILLTIGRAA